ncbi:MULTISPECIES: hypothetical protein [Streptomyces]|uniref:hypothetical protein n=1 Tax=Streptomyces TaxID=1883 RepID=UPI00240E4BE4|nr:MULTISPECIES: hypothetical protein [Streptomyces]WFB88564.1 hypothetical protein MMU79_37670 [Streptomyces olivaceus]WGK50705.1 hypothetical protein M6G09_36695 [Streptomyces sp. B146]
MKRMKFGRSVAVAVLSGAAALTMVMGGTTTASAGEQSVQAVQYVGSYSSILACQLAALSYQSSEGRTYWCDGVYLFRLV